MEERPGEFTKGASYETYIAFFGIEDKDVQEICEELLALIAKYDVGSC